MTSGFRNPSAAPTGDSPDRAAAPSDRLLLERFVALSDQAAFAALVARHGPMVLGVCQRILRHRQDAEDAFQATFLVLARRARAVSRPDLLGHWLYGVACRTALKARGRPGVRKHEELVTDMPDAKPAERLEPDILAALDEEVNRLSEKYRLPLVLCYLEGKSTQDASQALGCPRGTILSRLARGRDRLRQRLTRRGIVLTGTALAAVLSRASVADSAMPAFPAEATVTGIASHAAAASQARLLADEVLRSMRQQVLWRWMAASAVAFVAVAAAALGYQTLIPSGPSVRAPNAERDTYALQGKWQVVTVRLNGSELVPANFPVNRLVVHGDTIVFESGGPPQEASFRLDPAATPKAIDLAFREELGSEIRAIYALDGYTLTICRPLTSRSNRPTEFASPQGSDLLVLICQRQRY
jgi:RNA polymerase sigma factor (sigma-70 family)